MGNGRGAEIIKIIHQLRKNIPGPVDDQRSEKDRPPQSVHSIVATKKSLSKNPRTAFAQALFAGTSLLCGSVLFLVAMTKKLLFTRVAFQCF